MFRKIFSDVWLCSWKFHKKHIFYLLLTFSQLPNEYIISFIPKNTNKTQKRSHFLGEIAIARSVDCDRAKRRLRSREIDEIVIAISPISIARSCKALIAITIDADRRNYGDHDRDQRRSFSLSLAERAWVFSFCGSLPLLRFFRKSFESKTTM